MLEVRILVTIKYLEENKILRIVRMFILFVILIVFDLINSIVWNTTTFRQQQLLSMLWIHINWVLCGRYMLLFFSSHTFFVSKKWHSHIWFLWSPLLRTSIRKRRSRFKISSNFSQTSFNCVQKLTSPHCLVFLSSVHILSHKWSNFIVFIFDFIITKNWFVFKDLLRVKWTNSKLKTIP